MNFDDIDTVKDSKIPDQKELEKELSEYLSKKYGDRVKIISPFVFPKASFDTEGGGDEKNKKSVDAIDFSMKPEELEAFLYETMYRHYRVARMARKARRFVKEMFQEYVRHPEQLPPEYQQWGQEEGIERSVCDYLAGMTDRFAQDEYRRLFHPFERVFWASKR